MHQTTKLKLIATAIVLGTIAFIATILTFALRDDGNIIISEAPKPEERLQTYTVQGLTVQTTTTPDMFAIMAMVILAQDQAERVAIMKEAHLSFSGPFAQLNQLLKPLELTPETLDTLDTAKAKCEAAGAGFAVYPMADEPGKSVTAYCNIKAKEIFRREF